MRTLPAGAGLVRRPKGDGVSEANEYIPLSPPCITKGDQTCSRRGMRTLPAGAGLVRRPKGDGVSEANEYIPLSPPCITKGDEILENSLEIQF
jgi:hypothetical protein